MAREPYHYWWILVGREAIPATPREWEAHRHTQRDFEDNCRIAKTELYDCEVSTVFLGLNHAPSLGPPVLFETMVLGGLLDGHQWRYSTYDEAERGHEEVVGMVRLEYGLAEVPASEAVDKDDGGAR